jgi:hypothetical protein
MRSLISGVQIMTGSEAFCDTRPILFIIIIIINNY